MFSTVSSSGSQTFSRQEPLNWHKLRFNKDFCFLMFLLQKVYETQDQNSHTFCHCVLWNYMKTNYSLFCWGPPGTPSRTPTLRTTAFKAWCVRMVTIWMCFCPISAWTLEPNWHFTLLFHLNLFNSETNRRQKCKCGVFYKPNDEAQLLHCRASTWRVNQ